MPRRLIRKRYRYSSVDKYEDVFDTALELMQRLVPGTTLNSLHRVIYLPHPGANDSICGSAVKQQVSQVNQSINANKAVVGGIFGCFSNFEKCRPKVADDVISDVAVD